MLKPALARGELHCVGRRRLMNTVSTLKKTLRWNVVSRKCSLLSRR
jgi:hypothetical protein